MKCKYDFSIDFFSSLHLNILYFLVAGCNIYVVNFSRIDQEYILIFSCYQIYAIHYKIVENMSQDLPYSFLGVVFFNQCLPWFRTVHFFLFVCSAMWHVGSQFPNQGLNSDPLHWEHGVLTTGPPGSPGLLFFTQWPSVGFQMVVPYS